MKLATDFDRAIRGTDFGVDLMVGTVRGMLMGTQALLPKEKQITPKQLAQTLAEVRARSRPAMEQMALVNGLYTYRSLADAEFAEYIAFWASAPGAAVGAKTAAAINTAFDKLAVDLGDISAALAQKYPPKK